MITRAHLAAIVGLVAGAVAVTAPSRAAGVDPISATPVQREQANSRYARGHKLLDAGKYAEALAEFRASLEIVASPNARYQAARCLREMNRLVEAYAEFGRAEIEARESVQQDPRYAKAADAALAARNEIAPKIGFVTVTVQNATDATTLKVGSETIRRAAWTEPAPCAPGTTEIVVATPGKEPITRSITLQAGARTAITIDAASAPNDASSARPQGDVRVEPVEADSGRDKANLRTYAYVAGGVGAAGLLVFVVEGLSANSTYSDLQSSCHTTCPPSKASEISSGKTQQTLANVGLAIGVIGIGVGATLWVMGAPKDSSAPSAAVVVGPAWIGVRGRM